MNYLKRPLFHLGRVHADRVALAALDKSKNNLTDLLIRHQVGDWGDVCEEARESNEWALATKQHPFRSVYKLSCGHLLKIVTDSSQSETQITLVGALIL